MSPSTRNEFLVDLRLVQEEVRSGVVPAYSIKKDGHWNIWLEYCRTHKLDPFLHGIKDKVAILQVFGRRFRVGKIAPRGKRVMSKSVQDAVRSVGQGFTVLGADDPRHASDGKIDFRLKRQFRSYKKEDRPSIQVKPLPICIIMAIVAHSARPSTSAHAKSLANLVCIAFFFLLRPGEYTGTVTDDQAFSLDDITLYVHSRRLSNQHSTDEELLSATNLTLTFTTQKNMNNGQTIAHARSGHPMCCPVLATVRQLLMHRHAFRLHGRAYKGSTKLASIYSPTGKNVPLRASDFTTTIRLFAATKRTVTGVNPSEYSARSLRAGGAMALMAGKCDDNIIKLLGRWRSDAMMDYLHEQSLPIFKRLAGVMYNNGHHSFLPSETVPILAVG